MTALRAFEAVVRQGTLSDAARELHVTPAAISHRLRSLEAAAGRPLLYRDGRVFRATPFGQDVIATLGDAFQRIRQADALLRSHHKTRLYISAAYSFATMWLGPRLMGFAAEQPGLRPYLQPSHNPEKEPGADIVIVHSDRCPENGTWEVLFEDSCAVMGRADHPAVQPGGAGFGALDTANLIHIVHKDGSHAGEYSWQDWYAAQDLGRLRRVQHDAGVSAEHLAVEMILRGQSLALISTVNAHDHLIDGRLAIMPDSEVRSNRTYWIKRLVTKDAHPAATVFKTWLRAQLAEIVPL